LFSPNGIWQFGKADPEKLSDQGLDKPFSKKLKETLIAWQTHRSQLKGIYMDAMKYDQLDSYRETVLNNILCDLQTKVDLGSPAT